MFGPNYVTIYKQRLHGEGKESIYVDVMVVNHIQRTLAELIGPVSPSLPGATYCLFKETTDAYLLYLSLSIKLQVDRSTPWGPSSTMRKRGMRPTP